MGGGNKRKRDGEMKRGWQIEGKRDRKDESDLSIMKSAPVCVELCASFSLSAVTDGFYPFNIPQISVRRCMSIIWALRLLTGPTFGVKLSLLTISDSAQSQLHTLEAERGHNNTRKTGTKQAPNSQSPNSLLSFHNNWHIFLISDEVWLHCWRLQSRKKVVKTVNPMSLTPRALFLPLVLLHQFVFFLITL